MVSTLSLPIQRSPCNGGAIQNKGSSSASDLEDSSDNESDVIEENGFMKSVLCQEWQDQHKPMGYYLAWLDLVVQGWGPCLGAVQATYLAVQQILPITMDQEVHVKCSHSMQTLLSSSSCGSRKYAKMDSIVGNIDSDH